MEITFPAAKEAANNRAHRISLARAADFDMDAALVVVDDSQDYGETRYNAIGFLDGRLHSLTFTMRNDGRELRAISLRKASPSERKAYAEI